MKSYHKKRISNIFNTLSTILVIGGILFLLPFLIGIVYHDTMPISQLITAFILPGFGSVVVGLVIRSLTKSYTLSLKDSMIICTVSWVIMAAIGAIPFVVILDVSYLDGYFETMSGFTTTGTTVLQGLDTMPRSILFWRALTQWIGGLGILSMFLLVGFKGGAAANKLFLAEGHKISSRRPSPGLFRTAKILWIIYIAFTIAEMLILLLFRLSFFDAITHALTTLSTGGYSIYDQSIAHYRSEGFVHSSYIELIILFFMLCGGINFFVHYRVWTKELKALWDNTEMRYFWGILILSVLLIFISKTESEGYNSILYHLKDIGFQVVSIMTTTGYTTLDINSVYFTAFAKQLFLVLMVVGGCAGSTGGGIKVIRVSILSKLVGNRIHNLNSSRRTRAPLTIDNQRIGNDELNQLFALFYLWIGLLVVGGGITALFSNLSAWQSYSGMFSALGNIGPSYISVKEMIALRPVIKITYIMGMIAGRLEVLPIMLIFSRKYFK